jgi:hypothetical protein
MIVLPATINLQTAHAEEPSVKMIPSGRIQIMTYEEYKRDLDSMSLVDKQFMTALRTFSEKTSDDTNQHSRKSTDS